MTRVIRLIVLKLFSCILLILSNGVYAAEPVYSDQDWGKVLGSVVNAEGLVNYTALAQNRTELDSYLAIIRDTGPVSTPAQFSTREQQLAYYINAYNALVFEGVLSLPPDRKSVWSGLISGLNFFVRMDVELDGQTTNLRSLENDIVRDQFRDPRIHAALNCASISCPRLPQQPFKAEVLDQQLEDAMIEFVDDQRNVRIDDAGATVYLSEIFDWFEDDFLEYEKSQGVTDPSIVNYINRYRTSGGLIDPAFKVRFLKYNKGINRIDA